nr:DoxX-like family protein [Haliscomenobacter sp.]
MANGLFCKVLNLVPRHEQIVARILGETYARPLTLAIGLAEIGMAIWVLSRIKPRLNAVLQMAVWRSLNTLEFLWYPTYCYGVSSMLFCIFVRAAHLLP